jgi:aryl-alcohol dehydrogenase-like predicted oxidoreductase
VKLKFADFSSKIVIGTAQFGLDYGIANTKGKISREKVFEILDFCWENGIKYFDTAPNYNSEKIIGEFIKVNGLEDKISIATKIPPNSRKLNYQTHIEESIERSINNLNNSIKTLFFHNANDSKILINDISYFKDIRTIYNIDLIGVSVYDTCEIQRLLDVKLDFAFQFPYNVLDIRFKNLNYRGSKNFIRSVFLQGLLASKNSLRTNAPKFLTKLQKEYHDTLEKFELDPIEYALSFAVNFKLSDYILVGIDTLSQLKHLLNCNIYPNKNLIHFDNYIKDKDQKWVDPRNWV